MPAKRIDIEIEQGAEWNPIYTWEKDNGDPIDITGYSAVMEIREDKDKNSNLIHRVSNTDFTLGGVNGTIRPFISATETGAFTFDWAWYDIKLTPPSGASKDIRLAQGQVNLDKAVTE